MADLFDYIGSGDTCLGCAGVISSGEIAATLDRPERLLCVACWWLQSCDLPLPRWDRPPARRHNLAGVFHFRRNRPEAE